MSSINSESLQRQRDVAFPTVCISEIKGGIYLPNTPTFKGYIHDKKGERVICVEINDVSDEQSKSKKQIIITVPNRGATASISSGEHSVITYTKTIDLEQLSSEYLESIKENNEPQYRQRIIELELLKRASEIFSNVDSDENVTWSQIKKTNRLLAFLQSIELLDGVEVQASFANGIQHDSALDLESLTLTEDATTIKDPLTGLYGKGRLISDVILHDPVIQAIEKPCMLSIDIAGMGIANAALGKEAVDDYVRGFAEILKKRFGSSCCFRIGGDEFVVFTSAKSKKILEAELLSLKNELKEYREEFYCKHDVDILKAQKEFRFRSCIDEVLTEFKTKYKELLSPKKEKKELDKIKMGILFKRDPYKTMGFNVETLFDTFLQEKYGAEAQGFNSTEMLISVAKSKMEKAEKDSGINVLGEYVAPVELNSDKGVSLSDVFVGLIFGDKGVQTAKANPDSSYQPKRPKENENPIMRKALQDQIASVNLLTPQKNRSERKGISKMDSQHGFINAWGNAMKDYSLQGKALRYDMIKDRAVGEIFQISQERQMYVFQLDKEGFGIDNKVHGSERADKMLENMIEAVKSYSGNCLVIRDKGGRLTFFVSVPLVSTEQECQLREANIAQRKYSKGIQLDEDEKSAAQYAHPVVEELKTIAYYSAREYSGYLEGIKRTALQVAFKDHSPLDFKKPEVLDNRKIHLSHGTILLMPEMSIKELIDYMITQLSPLPTDWIDDPVYVVVNSN